METVAGLLWIAGGVIAIALVCKLLPHGQHALEEERHDDHPRLDAHRMLISDSIHNVGDCILLAATYSISPMVGFAATVSVFLHEVVQEIAEFFVLRDAGYSVRRALFLNFATSTTILIGAIGGYVVIELFETFEGPLLAVATGGVLSVVFYDLVPHSIRDARLKSTFAQHILWFLLGCILMYGMMNLVPHEHPDHGEELVSQQLVNIA